MIAGVLESTSSALIAAIATAFGSWLVYRRAVRKDDRTADVEDQKVEVDRERSVSEMWAEYAERMEGRLERAERAVEDSRTELYLVKKELMEVQVNAAMCAAEVAKLKQRLAAAGIDHDD